VTTADNNEYLSSLDSNEVRLSSLDSNEVRLSSLDSNEVRLGLRAGGKLAWMLVE